jgi:hypothetical protein
VEADANGTYKTAQRLFELDFKAGAYGLRSGKSLLDVRAQGSFAGDPAKPIPLTKGSAELGAFTADLGGTLTLGQGGARVDGSFRTTSMSCDRLARLQVEKSLGTFGAWFVDYMKSSGAATVVGTLNVQGTFAFDTKAPRDAKIAWLTKETCGLRLFSTSSSP